MATHKVIEPNYGEFHYGESPVDAADLTNAGPLKYGTCANCGALTVADGDDGCTES